MLGEHTLKEESPFSPSRVKYGFHSSPCIHDFFPSIKLLMPVFLTNSGLKKCIKVVLLAG